MRKTLFLFLALSSVPCVLGAQADSMHTRYDRANPPPDHVALRPFLRSATRITDERSRHRRVYDIQSNIDFATFEEAADFLDFLVAASTDLVDDRDSYFRETLCPFDTPRPSGTEVLDVMNSLNDYEDASAHHYLAKISGELGAERYAQFLSWLNKRKKGMTILRSNYAEQYKGRDPDVVRQDICSRMAPM